MHVAGTQNTAATFLSRIDLNPKERVELEIRKDTIRPIQVNLRSTDFGGEEQLFLLLLKTIETNRSRQHARAEDTTKIKMTTEETAPIPINKAS